MKKITLTLFVALLGLFSVASAQNLEEVLENYFEVAGQETLLASDNTVSTGKMLQSGLEIPFKQYSAAPNKFRLEATFQGMTMIQTYNGEEGWSLNPFAGQTEPQPMGEIELKAIAVQSDYEGMLWNWKEKGYTVTLEENEEVEGTDCFVIKTVNGEDEYTNFIDAENYILIKTHTKMMVDGNAIESDTYMSNYQEGDGYIFPGKIETRLNGQVQNTIVLDEMSLDADLDDSMFGKPTK